MQTVTAVDALHAAIGRFQTRADFRKALESSCGEKIPNSRIHNWLVRDKKTPVGMCPHVESLTGVPCELLNPTDMDWALMRALFRRRTRGQSQESLTTQAKQ